ncbi:hypothetical protein PTSG_08243 [Salpingoeca rosetta]|uniref:HTTM-like domain-containing protein n=1 Tax=Salpingoeca rosetta (strain ATCC 50818 / BSB-021) TaxID=946362 RepID=F2UIE9_SALR5|nr:uncharacterized protein PTSG_08243 [Salpingoeca rosetta]EGD76898.1 hypothetical protein PTSG_08243 [Salpingoeca rosetta]|eukprot:XP_004991269.1 hypothetical protein PTSG_08243 [Salpingoeca rosetta]
MTATTTAMRWLLAKVAAPFQLDQRAVVLCRVILGTYALVDLFLRLCMSGGIHWYTGSDVDPAAAVAVEDTPHGAWIHKVLFYRGSVEFQTAVFTVHIAIAALFTLGWRPRVTSLLLWLATVCMHGRQECFHDGSDKYFRNLLLWCCFMDLRPPSRPMSQHGSSAPPAPVMRTQLSVGTVGYVLQMCLMYAGVIVLRCQDGHTWFDGTAVGYALGASFATRPPANELVAFPDACKLLSYAGMVGEAIIPVMILLTTRRSTRMRLATIANTAAVHAGIFVMFYLPQWSAFATLATLILLPSVALDWMEVHLPLVARIWATARRPSAQDKQEQQTGDKAADRGGDDQSVSANSAPPTSSPPTSSSWGGRAWRVIGCVLMVYMVHEWLATDARVITSFDDGDIGQALRFYQGWVMFSNPSGYSKWYTVHATVPARFIAQQQQEEEEQLYSYGMLEVDVLASLRQGRVVVTTRDEMERQRTTIPTCTSCLYASWRYERFLHKVQERSHEHLRRRAIWPLSRHWCHVLSGMGQRDTAAGALTLQNGTHVDHVYWGDMGLRTSVNLYRVQPPTPTQNAFTRRRTRTDVDVTIKCFTWPEFNDAPGEERGGGGGGARGTRGSSAEARKQTQQRTQEL